MGSTQRWGWTSVGRVLACPVHDPLGFHPQHLKIMLVYAHNPRTQLLEEGILGVQGHLLVWGQPRTLKAPPLSFTLKNHLVWTVCDCSQVVMGNSILYFKICFISCVWVFAWMYIHQVYTAWRGDQVSWSEPPCGCPSRALSIYLTAELSIEDVLLC